jgi:prevent-host-death family protein
MSTRISVSDAKAQLTELVRRAEAGEEIVLTRHGHEVIRLAPISLPVTADRRRQVLRELRAATLSKFTPGPGAARSQDFLYGDDGLPQ